MPKCETCKKDIDTFNEGYFTETGLDYCEKCYGDKRWGEVDADTRKAWRQNVKTVWHTWIKEAPNEVEKKRRRDFVKRFKVPSALEVEVDAV